MEYLDVVDRNGIPTGEVIERTAAHAEGVLHRTSHVWLLRRREGKLQILLQKRCESKDSFPGCYDISSAGHIPAGFDYRESAVRELYEELGVSCCEEDLVTCGHRLVVHDEVFHDKEFHDRQYSKVFYLMADIDEKDIVVQKEEIESVLWMDFDECYNAVKLQLIKNCICIDELDMIKRALGESTN